MRKDFKMTYADLILEWFDKNKRDMPWRRTSDPYCIWVSEVMLQQTQVVTVIPYYLRFIERFPDVSALAEASLEEVHNYWQGLGYYRRGENLWKGAKLIADKWQGEFPRDPRLIKEIPGIGPYTLGAICSIALHLPLPAVDGNVMRILARQFCIGEDIANPKNRKLFEDKVMELMPNDPNRFNQALMELGALICTPKNPNCKECPMKPICEAYQKNVQEEYPVKLKKVKAVELNYKVLLIEKGSKIGMIKRPEEGLLANLWGFPMIEEKDWESIDLEAIKPVYLEQVTHVFTHRKWHMKPVILNWSQPLEKTLGPLLQEQGEIQYIEKNDLKNLPIATAFKKVMKKKQVTV